MTLDRKTLIEDIAESACDGIDLKDLVAFYYDHQVDWLSELNNDELVNHAEEYFYSFELEDYEEEDDDN